MSYMNTDRIEPRRAAALFFLAWGLLVWSNRVAAAEPQLFPAEVMLTGPGASQRLLVVGVDGKQVVGDRTAQAKFVSSNPAVTTVSDAGLVKAVGDGEAVITASHDGKQSTATVKVTR